MPRKATSGQPLKSKEVDYTLSSFANFNSLLQAYLKSKTNKQKCTAALCSYLRSLHVLHESLPDECVKQYHLTQLIYTYTDSLLQIYVEYSDFDSMKELIKQDLTDVSQLVILCAMYAPEKLHTVVTKFPEISQNIYGEKEDYVKLADELGCETLREVVEACVKERNKDKSKAIEALQEQMKLLGISKEDL
jgi:hypothetical protein